LKALIYSAPGKVEVKDLPRPEVREGEGLIQVRAAGICGTDLYILDGTHPRARPPLVLGHEFYGELIETDDPEGDSDLRVGDTVVPYPLISCGSCISCRSGYQHACRRLRLLGIDRPGGMSEFSSVPLDKLVKIGKEIDPAAGVLVEPLAVVIHSLRESPVSVGDKVLVVGGGPIGFLLCLLLDHCGVKDTLVSEINPCRATILSESGFRVLNPLEESLEQTVSDITRGEGMDVLFEVSAASTSALEMASLVRPRGTIVMISLYKEPVPVDLATIHFREITLKATRVYTRLDYDRAVNLAASGEMPIQRVVTHRFTLDRAEEGLKTARDSRKALKVMIDCMGA